MAEQKQIEISLEEGRYNELKLLCDLPDPQEIQTGLPIADNFNLTLIFHEGGLHIAKLETSLRAYAVPYHKEVRIIDTSPTNSGPLKVGTEEEQHALFR
ncbi:hypothetical protein [Neptuniibacter sp. QD37_11]|uniref:hypothetical protein n=1 Tax=Neptuniibacter sp. QD37_11 TaxID=3398209 RepID=UPI0039F596C8